MSEKLDAEDGDAREPIDANDRGSAHDKISTSDNMEGSGNAEEAPEPKFLGFWHPDLKRTRTVVFTKWARTGMDSNKINEFGVWLNNK